MSRRHGKLGLAVVFSTSLCGGCAVPQFDVPVDSTTGAPTVNTIVSRVKCEMLDMVRNDRGNDDPNSQDRLFLLDYDFDLVVALALEVNDTGGLAPSLSFIDPLSKVASFTLGTTAVLSESRDRSFSETLQFSFRNIYTNWQQHQDWYQCPVASTNLDGDLELHRFVATADLSPNLVTSTPAAAAPAASAKADAPAASAKPAVFGGSDQFLITKNLSALGPTWSLVHFKGPGALSLSEVNTDKLTFSFAVGPDAGHKMKENAFYPPNHRNEEAYDYLNTLNINSLNSSINNLQNVLH